MILKLLIPVLCNAVLAVLLYMTEKKTPFGKADRCHFFNRVRR